MKRRRKRTTIQVHNFTGAGRPHVKWRVDRKPKNWDRWSTARQWDWLEDHPQTPGPRVVRASSGDSILSSRARARRRNPGGDYSALYLWGGGVLALGVLAYWQREVIVDVISRGTRLTYAAVGTDGVVPVSPTSLRATASEVMGREVSQEAYDLGRMARSEGAAAAEIRIHVALNDAADLGWTVHTLITYANNPRCKGWFGEQFTPASRAPGGVACSRRYATSKDPFAGDIETAERVMAEHAAGVDPTGGAVKFVDISSMGGVQEGSGSYAALVANWAKDGLQPFTLPGYSDDLVVFRRTG